MLIGIGGVSRSGKSTLAEQLFAEAQKHRSAYILHQDAFVRPRDELPRIRDHIDWELPATIDWIRLHNSIIQACAKKEVVIIEGLFAFAHAAINTQYDRGICMHIPRELFWQRKLMDTRWGREPDWYIEHIWQRHLQYGRPPATIKPMTYLSGSIPVPDAIVRALLR